MLAFTTSGKILLSRLKLRACQFSNISDFGLKRARQKYANVVYDGDFAA